MVSFPTPTMIKTNGIDMAVYEAGPKDGVPVVMCHGFPELAYSWRKIMGPLAAAGYHVVAPDLRGYGRTTGWSANYDDDLHPFRHLNAVRDALGLIAALGYRETAVRRWSGTISAPGSRPGAHSCGPTCSAGWR